jgi:hypothetical protein
MYYVIVNPETYPMNWTWLTGRISEEQLRHEHRGEWERVLGTEDDEAGSSQAAAGGAEASLQSTGGASGGGDRGASPEPGSRSADGGTGPADDPRPDQPPGHPSG